MKMNAKNFEKTNDVWGAIKEIRRVIMNFWGKHQKLSVGFQLLSLATRTIDDELKAVHKEIDALEESNTRITARLDQLETRLQQKEKSE